jgi:segregation and condensation protein B
MTNQADEPGQARPEDVPEPMQDSPAMPAAADQATPDSMAGAEQAPPPVVEDAASGQTPAEADDAPPDPALLAAAVRLAEALVYASDKPVTPAMLGAILPEGLTAGLVMAALAEACEGRGVVLTEVAGGWAFRTAPDLAQRLTKVVQAPRRLPRAAMEALSIIAYHQPCTRGEIEEIRGAALAQTTLEALLELGLVAPRGRREVPGRPTLWGTTPKFLEQFSLRAISDLPRKEELVTAETGPPLPLQGMRPGPAVEPPPDVEPPPEVDTAPAADPDATPDAEQDDPPAAPTGS